MHRAEVQVREQRKVGLQNYIQTIFDQFNRSTKANQLKAKGDIRSLDAALSQGIWMICTKFAEGIDGLHRDVSGLGEGSSLQ